MENKHLLEKLQMYLDGMNDVGISSEDEMYIYGYAQCINHVAKILGEDDSTYGVLEKQK